MAKVKSIIREGEVTFMSDPNIEFVSLVGHAANQQPFKIIKGQVKGDNNMRKVIHSILVPKDIGEEKTQELSETYKLDEKSEQELEGYDVYKQVSDEEVDLETKSVAAIDKEANVYGIVMDLKEESKEEPTEKELDYATMDNLADAAFAMMDVVFGAIRQPEAEGEQRKSMVLQAVDNFKGCAEAILSNIKSEDVATKIEVKGENLKDLFTQEEPEEKTEELDSKIEELAQSIETKAEEKAQAKIEEFKAEYEEMKEQLNQKLNDELEKFALKEDAEKQFNEVKSELENIKNTATQRKSEIEETNKETKVEKNRPKRDFITFA